MNEMIAMDGYGSYVWGAFGISVVALTLTVALYRRQLTRIRQQLRRYLGNRSEEQS